MMISLARPVADFCGHRVRAGFYEATDDDEAPPPLEIFSTGNGLNVKRGRGRNGRACPRCRELLINSFRE